MPRLVDTMTDSSRYGSLEGQWQLASYSSIVSVLPPPTRTDLFYREEADQDGPLLLRHSRVTLIDNEVYTRGLEETMREYADIWRTLARR